MISKEQYCIILLDKFEKAEGHKAEEYDVVAMEYLGLLKNPTYVLYASERTGVLNTYIVEEKRGVAMLTVRYLMRMLPDKVDLMMS